MKRNRRLTRRKTRTKKPMMQTLTRAQQNVSRLPEGRLAKGPATETKCALTQDQPKEEDEKFKRLKPKGPASSPVPVGGDPEPTEVNEILK